jgi:hypothetical protein
MKMVTFKMDKGRRRLTAWPDKVCIISSDANPDVCVAEVENVVNEGGETCDWHINHSEKEAIEMLEEARNAISEPIYDHQCASEDEYE